jgi:uncharacterized protein with PQ loop repeat
MQHGITHHMHKRKRVHQKLRKFPHPNKKIRFLDNMLLIIAVLGPLSTIPQLTKIFISKNAAGVSTLTFGFFAAFDIPWIIYGMVHKEKPIVLAYTLWLIANLTIVIGTIIY